jgi:hypothetical protein
MKCNLANRKRRIISLASSLVALFLVAAQLVAAQEVSRRERWKVQSNRKHANCARGTYRNPAPKR